MASPALLRMLATVYILWTCLPLRCAVAKAQLEYPVSTRHFPAHPPDIARPNANVAKRGSDLYSLWNSIPATKVAKGDSAKFFEIDQSEDDAWAIAYLHGCTALMISDPNFVIVAHVQQDTRHGTRCIGDAVALDKYLEQTLLPALDQHDATAFTKVDLLYNVCDTKRSGWAIQTIKKYLTEGNFDGFDDVANIAVHGYSGGGIGEPKQDSPAGLAVVQWMKPQLPIVTIGTRRVFFGSTAGERPIRDDVFVHH